MSGARSPYRKSVRSDGVLSERAGEYWDANRDKARDPAFWMAHPLCREVINRRVTGSPREWPLDWLRRVHVAEPFERGVTWGCGTGAFERSLIRTDVVRSGASRWGRVGIRAAVGPESSQPIAATASPDRSNVPAKDRLRAR